MAAIEKQIKEIKVTTNGGDAESLAALTTCSCKQERPDTTISSDPPLYRSLTASMSVTCSTRSPVAVGMAIVTGMVIVTVTVM